LMLDIVQYFVLTSHRHGSTLSANF
jgi:hypothetical protein